jgi:hypothetical protein
MTEEQLCDYCGEELGDEPIRAGSRVYCSEACAFEAGRSADCGGRTDSSISQPRIEMPEPPESGK